MSDDSLSEPVLGDRFKWKHWKLIFSSLSFSQMFGRGRCWRLLRGPLTTERVLSGAALGPADRLVEDSDWMAAGWKVLEAWALCTPPVLPQAQPSPGQAPELLDTAVASPGADGALAVS